MANTFKNKKIATESSYIEQLQTLQNQIDDISKNITYLDVYNIIDTVESKDQLNIKVAGLVNNSSLVINCQNFQEGDENYATGDIVLKDNTGNLIHIEAQPGGVYYPIGITENGSNHIIKYKYAAGVPEKGSSFPGATPTALTDIQPCETMSFPINITPGNGFIYGHWIKKNNEKTSFNSYQDVQPQIQVWFADEDDNPAEQVYCDFALTLQEGEYIISNLPNNTWVKVK